MGRALCARPAGKNSSAVESISRDPDIELLPLTAETLTLTPEALSGVDDLLAVRKKPAVNIPKDKPGPSSTLTDSCWVQYGSHVLSKKQFQQVLQGKQLCDLHINAFQCLLKSIFPYTDGLQNTLFQAH